MPNINQSSILENLPYYSWPKNKSYYALSRISIFVDNKYVIKYEGIA